MGTKTGLTKTGLLAVDEEVSVSDSAMELHAIITQFDQNPNHQQYCEESKKISWISLTLTLTLTIFYFFKPRKKWKGEKIGGDDRWPYNKRDPMQENSQLTEVYKEGENE